MAAIIFYLCSTCGATFSLHRAGAQRALNRQLLDYATRLERRCSIGNDEDQRADTLGVDHRTNKDRRAAGLRCRSQNSSWLQDHTAVAVGQKCSATHSDD